MVLAGERSIGDISTCFILCLLLASDDALHADSLAKGPDEYAPASWRRRAGKQCTAGTAANEPADRLGMMDTAVSECPSWDTMPHYHVRRLPPGGAHWPAVLRALGIP